VGNSSLSWPGKIVSIEGLQLEQSGLQDEQMALLQHRSFQESKASWLHIAQKKLLLPALGNTVVGSVLGSY
jgi:hypothetical protein